MATRVATLGSHRYGVFTEAEALGSGLTKRALRRRITDGRFVVLHPGVYAYAGTILSWRAHLSAACLWSREGIASHRSAAALFGFKGFLEQGRPEITVTSCHLPPRSGILVHVTDRLPPAQRATRLGVPVTCVERTFLDLCAVCPEQRVAIALDDALLKGLTTTERLDECLRMTARRGRRGCGRLRRLLKPRLDLTQVPNSAAETVLFEVLRQSGLPDPQLQHEIRDADGFVVARLDFAWPERKFAVEMDGYEFHWGRDAFERDRERLNRLTLLGWSILHATWREATRSPGRLLHRIHDAYEAASRSL